MEAGTNGTATASSAAAGDSSSTSWTNDQHADGGHSFAGEAPKASKKVRPKPLAEVLAKVLPLLQRRDLYQFFAFPVSAAEVPEYHSIISHPMDFATMESKLKGGEYSSLDNFRHDFLLITENAQYFNLIDGPSGIIHTEAKKLQDWGLRTIAREGAAVQEEFHEDAEKTGPPIKGSNGKLNVRLKKLMSPSSSTNATPRVTTPSRLHQVVKMEEEEDEDEEELSRNEYDAYSETGTSSGRGVSMSVDDTGTPGTRDSPEAARKYTKRTTAPRAPYTHKKNRPRQSTVASLVAAAVKDEDGEQQTGVAPISSTSGFLAASIPLLYDADGSIALDRLTEDERRTLLRASGMDEWSDVLNPFVESVLPLHAEVQSQISTLARPLTSVVDGLGSALLPTPMPSSSSFNYDVADLPPEQQKSPFAISSGHEFERQGEKASIPLAWPRPTLGNAGGPSNAGDTSQSRFLKGRDREKEREAAGSGNLDDWTFTRAHLAKLLEPLDLGLYPGLLPTAWINHIRSSKGGPARSRLPPYHLSLGSTLGNALQEELASLPNRVLLAGKPGLAHSLPAVPDMASDVATAIAETSASNKQNAEDEARTSGTRGSDIIREVVFGGVVGEAYASSVYDFVSGAAASARARQGENADRDEQETALSQWQSQLTPIRLERIVPSYFDEAGELLDGDSYTGMSLIPLDVRKEAGMSGRRAPSPFVQQASSDLTSEHKRASREPSFVSSKRQRIANTPMAEEAERSVPEPSNGLDDVTSAYLAGTLLDQPLLEHVRDHIIAPLTGNLLGVLACAGSAVEQHQAAAGKGKIAHSNSEISKESLPERISTLLDGHLESLENLLRDDINVPQSSLQENAMEGQVRKLVESVIKGHYKQNRRRIIELTRAKEEVIELEALVRAKEEMLNESLQTKEDMPLRWSSMEMDSAKIAKALEQYASILSSLSSFCEDGKTIDAELLDQMRLAYIAMARQAPTKELARGQWAAWAEYLQQQMAHQKQWQHKAGLSSPNADIPPSVVTEKQADPTAVANITQHKSPSGQ